MSGPWDVLGRVERLTSLWHAGMSSRDIARELGVSNGAVTGKAARLGLPARVACLQKGGWADKVFTAERLDLAKRLTAAGVTREAMLAQINALPGRPVASVESLHHALWRRGIQPTRAPRPSARNPAVTRPKRPSDTRRTTHRERLHAAERVAVDAPAAASPEPPMPLPAAPPAQVAPRTHPTLTCQFIAGDARPWTACGKPVRMKRTPRGDMVPCWTCEEHARVCFTTVSIQAAA